MKFSTGLDIRRHINLILLIGCNFVICCLFEYRLNTDKHDHVVFYFLDHLSYLVFVELKETKSHETYYIYVHSIYTMFVSICSVIPSSKINNILYFVNIWFACCNLLIFQAEASNTNVYMNCVFCQHLSIISTITKSATIQFHSLSSFVIVKIKTGL